MIACGWGCGRGRGGDDDEVFVVLGFCFFGEVDGCEGDGCGRFLLLLTSGGFVEAGVPRAGSVVEDLGFRRADCALVVTMFRFFRLFG